jgi:hypothetical protein
MRITTDEWDRLILSNGAEIKFDRKSAVDADDVGKILKILDIFDTQLSEFNSAITKLTEYVDIEIGSLNCQIEEINDRLYDLDGKGA